MCDCANVRITFFPRKFLARWRLWCLSCKRTCRGCVVRMMCPRVSVIIPVFRSEQVLARALGSLLAQDEKQWEAVVVDDGSPESSWRVTQAYAWIDPRI